MEITPFYGDQPLSVQHVVVRVNPEDQERADALVLRTQAIVTVEDTPSFNLAKGAAGQLKALLNEIETGKKACKQPFAAIGEAVNEQARAVGNPVLIEHQRILGLLNGYVARLEAAEKEAERKAAEVIRLAQEEHDRKIRAAQEAQLKAEAEARAAQGIAEREKARADANAQMLVAAQEQLAKEMALEAASIGADKPKRSLVPGGRVDHPYEFKLRSLRETINAGCINLLRWELDIRACQDSVRAQLEIDPNCMPSLPGIEVTRTINVSVKASARVL